MRWGNYDEVAKEAVEAGFRIAYQRDVEIHYDYSNPRDDVVRFIQLLVGSKFSESEVRAAIDDTYRQPQMHVSMKKLTIFTKQA